MVAGPESSLPNANAAGVPADQALEAGAPQLESDKELLEGGTINFDLPNFKGELKLNHQQTTIVMPLVMELMAAVSKNVGSGVVILAAGSEAKGKPVAESVVREYGRKLVSEIKNLFDVLGSVKDKGRTYAIEALGGTPGDSSKKLEQQQT